MHFFRWILYGIPIIFILLFIAAFINTDSFSTKKKNEMSLGVMAEPVTLNPIQASDSASADVINLLFNGLLKLNQDLELIGDLASAWSLSQITTFQFRNATEAAQAKELLTRIFHTDRNEEVAKADEARQARVLAPGCRDDMIFSGGQNRSLTLHSSAFPTSAVDWYEISGLTVQQAKHPEWNITSITSGNNPSQLLVTLTEPGYSASEAIASELLQTLPQEALSSFETWRLKRDKKHPAKKELFDALSAAVSTMLPHDNKITLQRYRLSDEEEEWILPTTFNLEHFLQEHAQEFPIKHTFQENHAFLAEPIINFTLRHDVRWHDGTSFTAADVAFTCHAILDDRIASSLRTNFELISKIETPDPWHVSIHYRRPFSPALNSWLSPILPAHLLEGKDPITWATFYNRHPIGTGPFRFDTWKSNSYVRLVRNTDYFQGSPWLDSIVFRILPDPLSLRLAFETHQVDFWGVDPWATKEFSNNPHFDLFESPGNSYSYIGWNLKSPFFADLKVRQALAQAINIPEMIHYILYGHGVPSTGIFTPKMWFFDPSIKPFVYNPEQAKALLDQAGWKVGPDGIRKRNGKRFSFTLLTNNSSEVRRDIATLAQDDLKKIGIEVKVELYEWTVFLKHVNQHDFDAVVLGWSLSNDFDQYSIWHSSQCHPEELNYTGYKNHHVDELLSKLRQEYSPSEIIKLAGELQQTIYHDQPYLFLFVPEGTSVQWKGAYRMRYPTDHGFIDSPLKSSKVGWNYNLEWFYRTDYPPDMK